MCPSTDSIKERNPISCDDMEGAKDHTIAHEVSQAQKTKTKNKKTTLMSSFTYAILKVDSIQVESRLAAPSGWR